MSENYFAKLNSINVNDKVEKKNGLSYVSWAYAWGELKKLFPDAVYTIYENAAGWNYHTDGKTCWVKTGVTVNGIEHIEYLPVMDFKNRSISADSVTSFDVNKAIQRSLTKAVARHGLGLYIYAGEDLPEGEEEPEKEPPKVRMPNIPKAAAPAAVATAPTLGGFNAKAALNQFMNENHLTGKAFGEMRKALIEMGLVKDIPSDQMTEKDVEALTKIMAFNFPDRVAK